MGVLAHSILPVMNPGMMEPTLKWVINRWPSVGLFRDHDGMAYAGLECVHNPQTNATSHLTGAVSPMRMSPQTNATSHLTGAVSPMRMSTHPLGMTQQGNCRACSTRRSREGQRRTAQQHNRLLVLLLLLVILKALGDVRRVAPVLHDVGDPHVLQDRCAICTCATQLSAVHRIQTRFQQAQ